MIDEPSLKVSANPDFSFILKFGLEKLDQSQRTVIFLSGHRFEKVLLESKDKYVNYVTICPFMERVHMKRVRSTQKT